MGSTVQLGHVNNNDDDDDDDDDGDGGSGNDNADTGTCVHASKKGVATWLVNTSLT